MQKKKKILELPEVLLLFHANKEKKTEGGFSYPGQQVF